MIQFARSVVRHENLLVATVMDTFTVELFESSLAFFEPSVLFKALVGARCSVFSRERRPFESIRLGRNPSARLRYRDRFLRWKAGNVPSQRRKSILWDQFGRLIDERGFQVIRDQLSGSFRYVLRRAPAC